MLLTLEVISPNGEALGANGNVSKFVDFKFKCKTAKYSGAPSWGRRRGLLQNVAYQRLNLAMNPNCDPPEIVHNQDCDKVQSCP